MKIQFLKNTAAIAAGVVVFVFSGNVSAECSLADKMPMQHQTSQVAKISVMNAWIPAAPPNSKVHAAYLQLDNFSGKNISLISISSPVFAKAEMHSSKIEEGVMVMQHLAQVEIPACGEVIFAPGGLHVMLVKAGRKLEPGDQIPLDLTFDNGTEIQIIATVKKYGTEMSMGHKHTGS